MLMYSIEHTFVYVDPNHKHIDGSTEGDGTSVDSPLWDFPATLAANTVYLVRRSIDEYAAEISSGTTCDSEALMIWGMPKVTDDWWDYIPEAAQMAWVDTDKPTAKAHIYFNTSTINSDTARALTMSDKCRYMDLRGFVFRNGYARYRCALDMGSNNYKETVYIDNIEFRDNDSDFTTGAVHSNYYCSNYISTGSSNYKTSSVSITNCTINQGYSATGLHIQHPQNLYINNIIVNLATHQPDTGRAIYWNSCSHMHPVVTIETCYVVLYPTTLGGYVSYVFDGATTRQLTVNNITARLGTNANIAPSSTTIYIRPILRTYLSGPGSTIENIGINYGALCTGASGALIETYMENSNTYYDGQRTAVFGQYVVVRNINITCGSGDTMTYSQGRQDTASGNVHNSSDGGLLRISRTSNYVVGATFNYLVQNVTINSPRGNALHAVGALLDLETNDISGGVYVDQCVGKINSISSYYPGYVLKENGGNLLHVGSITCNKNNPDYTYNSQNAVIASFSSNILCGETNTSFMGAQTSTTDKNCVYVCTNDSVSGNYTARTGRGSCQTWSINRVGSTGGCTLKLINEISDNANYPLVIGGSPFKGITVECEAGARVATIYMTLYGYNNFDEIKYRFITQIKLPDGSVVSSGNWSLDTTSVYENVEGSTSYKLEIPFTMEEDGEVEFTYLFNWYMVGAATYLDPYPVIA